MKDFPARLLNEHEVAAYLGVSVAWLQRGRWASYGPRYIRVGGPQGRLIRYRLSDLDDYIGQNCVETADTAGTDQ